MTPRQRTLQTLLYGTPDRVPLTPGHGRRSTRTAWHAQGLPETITDINRYAYEQIGGTLPWPESGPGFPVDERLIPRFDEKVIERRERSQIVQDWKGNICEIGNEYTLEHLRNAIDFVTRRWIRCPVESREDWEAIKPRYNPATPDRLPADAVDRAKRLHDRTHFLQFNFSGPFWQLREWVGFEQLCILFHDDPEFVRDMVTFWRDYITALLERAFEHVVPDAVHFSEDMAYKSFSMISPAMVRQFLLPTYRQWGEVIRSAGVPLYGIDSDGYIGDLIPIWIEAGVTFCDPIEVAAGNDIVGFRERFGRDIAFLGGIDKRAMAKGGRALDDEIARIAPVVASGGYIPGCDHGVPPDVSWPNYLDYVRHLAAITGWL